MRKTVIECNTCFGYGLWAIGDTVPVGPLDARDGAPTHPCPECGASRNPYKPRTDAPTAEVAQEDYEELIREVKETLQTLQDLYDKLEEYNKKNVP